MIFSKLFKRNNPAQIKQERESSSDEKILQALREKLGDAGSGVHEVRFQAANQEFGMQAAYTIGIAPSFSRKNFNALGLKEVEKDQQPPFGRPANIQGDYIKRGGSYQIPHYFVVKAESLEKLLGMTIDRGNAR